MSRTLSRFAALALTLACATSSLPAFAQTFGVETQNTLMPAAGGMAGVSISAPQDLISAINGNPATLTQFKGTQFTFSGAWAEPTFNLEQTSSLPLLSVDPFNAKSTAPGAANGNIGVTQDFSALGLPATFGIGFVTTSGAAIDFRPEPNSNGTNTSLAIFSVPVAIGFDVTDRFSLGASAAIGIAFFDGPFVGTGGMTTDYGLRGTIGANFAATEFTNIGAYYQTKEDFLFTDAIRFGAGFYQDIVMDLPPTIGVGFSNNQLACGNLLLAADFLYKQWDEADLFDAIYRNQFVAQFGTQYTMGRYKLRAGYAWAEDPLSSNPGITAGGVNPPGGIPAVYYTQALLAVTCQHRVTMGVGVEDVLPGVDLDLMAGGMFRDTAQEGPDTTTNVESYWVGLGLTWRFGRGSCERLPICDDWGCIE